MSFGFADHCATHAWSKVEADGESLEAVSSIHHDQGALKFLRLRGGFATLTDAARTVPPDAHQSALSNACWALSKSLEGLAVIRQVLDASSARADTRRNRLTRPREARPCGLCGFNRPDVRPMPPHRPLLGHPGRGWRASRRSWPFVCEPTRAGVAPECSPISQSVLAGLIDAASRH